MECINLDPLADKTQVHNASDTIDHARKPQSRLDRPADHADLRLARAEREADRGPRCVPRRAQIGKFGPESSKRALQVCAGLS